MYSVNLADPVTPRDRHKITGDRGVSLSVQEWGNPNGQPILFAHAFAMSYLGWLPQVQSHLADRFRLITFDRRGQLLGDYLSKPSQPSQLAVMPTMSFSPPVLQLHWLPAKQS